LLGVNADASRESLLSVQKKHDLPWQSFWDGPGGPICGNYHVDRFPTYVLIDPTGSIRWRCAGAPESKEMEARIQALLNEVTKTAQSS
jgi:hypothetical protein